MAENSGLGRRRTERTTGVSHREARSSALQELLNLKRSGGKRINNYEVKLEDEICDTLSEADYDRYVAQRRQEAAEFVVDDEGLGYIDGDDDDAWNSCPSDVDEDKPNKKKIVPDGKKKERPSKKATELAAAAALTGKRRVTSMLNEAALHATGRRARENSINGNRVGASTESILNEVLASITPADVEKEKEKKRKLDSHMRGNSRGQSSALQQRSFEADAVTDRVARSPRSRSLPIISQPELPCQEEQFAGSIAESCEDVATARSEEKESSEWETSVPPIVEEDIECQLVTERDNDEEESEDSPVNLESSVVNNKVEVRDELNAKIVDKSRPEEEASAAWQSLVEGAVESEDKKEETREDGLESDMKDLPLDADGNLSFYLVDAYEEDFGPDPGTIYLFGKVRTKGKDEYVSCCAVVQNLQRCVYAVPTPSSFADNALFDLEEAAKSGGDAEKRALKQKLQFLAEGMKMELRKKLMELNVERFTMNPVKRSYAFDRTDVPIGEHYYLKLTYPFKNKPIPSDLYGQHFTGLFGTHSSALELFLIKRKIKGPCWLSIANPVSCSSSSQVSWCKLEINVGSSKDVFVTPAGKAPQAIPQMVVAAVNVKTVINHKDNVNEIASVSVVYLRRVKVDMPMPLEDWNNPKMLNHFSIVRKLSGEILPVGFASQVLEVNNKFKATVLSQESSERALLNLLTVKLYQLDPDVLVGHNISGFDLDVLLHRLQACKIQSKTWSKIGRLRRSQMPRLGGGGNSFGSGAGPGHMACIAGRLLCDTYLSSRELLKETSYSLTELSRTRLGQHRKELLPSDIPLMYQSSPSLMELIKSGETDAWLALGLMFHLSVLPLTRQLTNISGNLWSKTLQGNRAQRVEYLLLHEFHSRKFIVPDKLSFRDNERSTNKRKPGAQRTPALDTQEPLGDEDEGSLEGAQNSVLKRKKAAYVGGLVLEPKKGLYDKFVLLLDFNSLYPSIIQEYNVCFTTVTKPADGSIPRLPSTSVLGVLPQVLKGLVERRKQVKAWLKRASGLKYQQFDLQQQALKLTANSIYGCLGFSNARFYAKPIAELITSQGREILQSTVDLAKNNLSLEVIYGDTDSIMIHTGLDDLNAAKAVGGKVIKEVNKRYRLLEIDLDGIYKRMLLLKKKKYAAVKVEVKPDGQTLEVIELKGLDIVRRDWSMLSKDIGNFVLEQILSGSSREAVVDAIHSELRKLQEDLRGGKVDLNKFIINKTLTKAPEDYPDAKSQPHLQVALRRRQDGHRVGCSVGDTVPYIICVERGTTGASSLSLAERARHPDELRTNNIGWDVDIEYYISQQVHPVVSRLCAPIEGTDAAHLANCLGLDSSKFHQAQTSNRQDDAFLSAATTLDDDDRYRHCEALQLVCPQCTKHYQFPGLDDVLAQNTEARAGESEAGDKSRASPDDLLRCPDCCRDGSSRRLSAAMLTNQVKQRAEEFIRRYYDGVMACDEDSCGLVTRNVSLRAVGDADRGCVCPNYPRCNGRLGRAYTEVDLYKQLTHFFRLLDLPRALDKVKEADARVAAELKLAPLRLTFDSAAKAVKKVRDRSGFRWVQLGTISVAVS